MRKNKLQDTNNRQTQLTNATLSLWDEHKLRATLDTKEQDPSQSPTFVSGITNMRPLTATIEKVVNR
jgi:hypothetical protein